MYCQKCGKQIEDKSRFCPYCGAKNVEEPVYEMQKQPADQPVPETKGIEKRRKNVPVVIAAAIVFLIVGILIIPDGKKDTNARGKVVGLEESTEKKELPENGSGKDLSAYAEYTEDELIRELGYEKNEYGMYPNEEHMNFMFTDGKLYMMMLNHTKDKEMSLYGVSFKDSVEEADTILKSKGFVKQGSYESSEIARDGSLESVKVLVTIYKENVTGYLYFINSDVNNRILSLTYSTDTEEVLEEEQYSDDPSVNDPSWEEQSDQDLPGEEEPEPEPAGQITYGTYFYDDGTGTTCDAEVGFYTDPAADYISIDCWWNDRNIVPFVGILEEQADGSYLAYDEEIDTEILVTFADGGMYVAVSSSDFPDAEELEGFYNLQKALNLNEVP